MVLLRKIIMTIHRYWVLRSSETYLNYLRKSGFKIGDNTYLHSPKTFRIDITRPSLITIGSDCRFNVRNSVIAHDIASRVFIKKYNDYLPSEGRITIGNNVVFGSDVTVLKGVTIGDNCIIGLISTKHISKVANIC